MVLKTAWSGELAHKFSQAQKLWTIDQCAPQIFSQLQVLNDGVFVRPIWIIKTKNFEFTNKCLVYVYSSASFSWAGKLVHASREISLQNRYITILTTEITPTTLLSKSKTPPLWYMTRSRISNLWQVNPNAHSRLEDVNVNAWNLWMVPLDSKAA